MICRHAGLLGSLLFLTAGPALAESSGWQVIGGSDSNPFQLRFGYAQPAVTYVIDCRVDKIIVTETGVTELMDIQTGQKVSDSPGSSITPGASAMALFTDRVQPKMIPAIAKANVTKGWDLTIELPKNDRAFRSLSTATTMSLMTTGWTGAVEIGPSDHAIIAGFVNRCGSH